MKRTTAFSILLATVAMTCVASLAQAQYVWIDAKGIKQFSDRSPPSSIPDKNILKAPGRPLVSVAPGDLSELAPPAPAAPAAENANKAAPSVADRNVEFNKRVSEKAAAGKKAAEEAQLKAAKAEQCAAAREYKAQLDSGERISTAGQGGERGYMSDAERATATAKTNKVLTACR